MLYTRGGYCQSEELYERLLAYIDANGFEICEPAYEEYPLNELCILEDKEYLMRVMVTVRARKANTPNTANEYSAKLPPGL